MNFLDILILLLIGVLVIAAWRRARRKGGCCGHCEDCGRNCHKPEKKNKL